MAKPEKTFEKGSCRAAIFYNEVEKDGKELRIPKVVVTRNYMDNDNEWKTTNSFNINDLPKLIMVATKAYDYLTEKKAE